MGSKITYIQWWLWLQTESSKPTNVWHACSCPNEKLTRRQFQLTLWIVFRTSHMVFWTVKCILLVKTWKKKHWDKYKQKQFDRLPLRWWPMFGLVVRWALSGERFAVAIGFDDLSKRMWLHRFKLDSTTLIRFVLVLNQYFITVPLL